MSFMSRRVEPLRVPTRVFGTRARRTIGRARRGAASISDERGAPRRRRRTARLRARRLLGIARTSPNARRSSWHAERFVVGVDDFNQALAGACHAPRAVRERRRQEVDDLPRPPLDRHHVDGRTRDELRMKHRAGQKQFSTTEGYIREAEHVREGFGEVLPPLPGHGR